MFTDVGFWEMAVIGVMALIVLGPERLPGAARAAGKWVGKARRMMGDMKRDIKAELDASEMDTLKDIGKDIKEAGSAFKSQVENAGDQMQAGLNKETSVMDSAIADALGKEKPVAPLKKKTVAKKATAKKPATKKKVSTKKKATNKAAAPKKKASARSTTTATKTVKKAKITSRAKVTTKAKASTKA